MLKVDTPNRSLGRGTAPPALVGTRADENSSTNRDHFSRALFIVPYLRRHGPEAPYHGWIHYCTYPSA